MQGSTRALTLRNAPFALHVDTGRLGVRLFIRSKTMYDSIPEDTDREIALLGVISNLREVTRVGVAALLHHVKSERDPVGIIARVMEEASMADPNQRRKLIETLRADVGLATPDTASGWMPIASCPEFPFEKDTWFRDGPSYLLWTGSYCTIGAYGYTQRGKGRWRSYHGTITPTHWMHLPVGPGA